MRRSAVLRESEGVDRGEEFGGFGGFVVLEGTDEVHLEIGQGGQIEGFGLHLLDAIFAEKAAGRLRRLRGWRLRGGFC